MANDSQRGYLSGIIQRGARTLSPDAPATLARPFIPSLTPSLAPISSEPLEIETFDEPPNPQKAFESDQAVEQPRITTRILPESSDNEPAIASPAKSPVPPGESVAPGNGPVLTPATDALPSQSPASPEIAPAEKDQWGKRLPRLISVSAEKVRRDSIHEALRTHDQTAAQQTAASNSSSIQTVQPLSIVEAVAHQVASVNAPGDRSSKVEQTEKSDAAVTSLLTHETARVELKQSQPPAESTSRPVVAEPAAGASNQIPDPPVLKETIIERGREVIVMQALPQQHEPSLTWSLPPVPRDEFSMPRQQLPPPRQESPKMTINRLDVQVVNQSVPPFAPLPPPPGPAPQLDGWNNLERYHLGHLDLIL